MDTTSADRCAHERDVRISIERSLAAQHRASHVAELAAALNRDDLQRQCQAECGDASPFRDVVLAPAAVAEQDAVEALRPHRFGDELVDAAGSIGRGVRRLLGLGAA
ncbi:hypothetical protein SAMN04488074_13652 [Lentzea albidocapillata subsp. violacea]|uniref:Uncharacterized protein n=1 Tax=Lentzea albidocapillata subsp. violacea TaxID=128104 RepID=A0A1G9Z0C8_9PSEU|nr:hypothetical protein [Lentzea albidocapillata]SDN14828.1 hypothetical protein SAMN04488074_13652 [Lentzea albidocapillata subsp. violacea]